MHTPSPTLTQKPTPTPTREAGPLQRRAAIEGLWLVVLLLFGAAVVAVSRASNHAQVEALERSRLALQAAAIEQNLARQLVGVHAALQSMRKDIASGTEPERSPRTRAQMAALAEAIPGLYALQWLTAKGRVQASNRADDEGRDEAGSAYFQAAMQRPDPALLRVSEPFFLAPGVYAIRLSIALVDAQGAFAGVLSATLDPSYFDTLLKSVLYADDMWAAIVHGTGVVLVVHPARQRRTGFNVARPGSLFTRHQQSGLKASVLVGGTPGDYDERIIAQHSLHPASLQMDHELVVSVSRNLDSVFAPWLRQTELVAALYAAFALAATLALFSLQRQRRVLARAADERVAQGRAESERLTLALRGGDLALWDVLMPSGQRTVNARWYEMLGYRPDEVGAGRAAWQALVHPDDLARVEAAMDAHLAGSTPAYEAQYRMRHADGRWLWIFARGVVVERNAAGQALRVVGTYLDITERVEAEEALRRSEESLSIMLHSIGDGVIATDPQGRVTRMNATAERMTGWSAQQGLGQPLGALFNICNAHTRQPVLDPVALVLQRGETVGMANDTLLLSRDGTQYQIADSAAPIRSASGEIVGVVLVFSDVSESYRMLEVLRRSEADMRALLDALGSGVVVHGPDAMVQGANPAACRMLGLSLEQLRGKAVIDPHWAFLEADGSSMPLERYPVMQVLTTGQPLVNFIAGLRRPDVEHPVWLQCDAFALRDAAGVLQQIIVTFNDITERRKADADRRVLERQLRESQKLESIGTLAGGIAHDFNNIVAAILGNADLARSGLRPEQAAWHHLDQIQRAGLRARSLVEQILTFSRQQSKPLVAQALRPLLDEIRQLLAATLPASVELVAAFSDTPLWIEADATKIHQVMMNLCTNAWHALPSQGGRIELGCERVSGAAPPGSPATDLAAAPCAHVWVRDNGSGMSRATVERIFDPFYTTKPVGQGTGLGLSVVHGIIRGHAGSVVVDSEPGQGSCFHLYFPLVEAPRTEAQHALAAPRSQVRGHGQHVLYVDDDELMRMMVQGLLERAGYAVVVCSSLEQALQQLRAEPERHELLITDFNMPGGSGLLLAQQVALLRPDLPVIITSGYITERLRQEAAAVGVRALLNKENTLEGLLPLVQQVLASASSTSSA